MVIIILSLNTERAAVMRLRAVQRCFYQFILLSLFFFVMHLFISNENHKLSQKLQIRVHVLLGKERDIKTFRIKSSENSKPEQEGEGEEVLRAKISTCS